MRISRRPSLRFLPLLLLAGTLHARPRFPFPSNPDQVWQNDLDLQEAIRDSANGQISGSSSSVSSIGYSTYVCNGTYANMAATTQFGNIKTISLPAGTWSVWGNVEYTLGGATITGNVFGATSLFSANTTTDHVIGYNSLDTTGPTSAADDNVGISNFYVNVATTTTVYLKARAAYTGGPPNAKGCIGANRIQ